MSRKGDSNGNRTGKEPKNGWTIVNKVDRKIKKAIQIGQEPKGY